MTNKKKKDSKRKSYLTGLILTVIGLSISSVGNILQYSQLQNTKKQIPPELEISYSYEALSNVLHISITNTGFVNIGKVWLEEEIFAIVDDQVFEGVDVPHFNYIIFNNSRDSLFKLDKGENYDIKLDSLESLAIHQITERFNAKVISNWKVSYQSIFAGKQFIFEKYFIHNNLNQMPSQLEIVTGGHGLKEKIERYKKYGEKREIRIFELTERFEINTPSHFIITEDSNIRSMDNQNYLTINELSESYALLGGGSDIQISDDMRGTLKWIWIYDRDRNKWSKNLLNVGKSTWHTEPFKSLLGYLRIEDYQKVINNPDKYASLTSGQITMGKLNIEEDEILLKARNKFIKDSKYR